MPSSDCSNKMVASAPFSLKLLYQMQQNTSSAVSQEPLYLYKGSHSMSPDPVAMHLAHTMTHYDETQRDPLMIMVTHYSKLNLQRKSIAQHGDNLSENFASVLQFLRGQRKYSELSLHLFMMSVRIRIFVSIFCLGSVLGSLPRRFVESLQCLI